MHEHYSDMVIMIPELIKFSKALGGLCYVCSDMDGFSSRSGLEEEDRAAPQGSSLRDTQYVHEAYVTMYIAKERDRGVAQVGILTNALLVLYICWIWFNNQ
jgi:hypothetical protein